jgi:hypothetical protein
MNRRTACLSIFLTLVWLSSLGAQGQVDQTGRYNAQVRATNVGKAGSMKQAASSRKSGIRSRKALSAPGTNPAPSNIGFLAAPQVPSGATDYSTFPGVVGNFSGAGKPPGTAMLVDTGFPSTPVINIFVALSSGNGTFTTALTPVGPTVTTESNPIFVGDVNGDGFDDIVILNEASPVTMSVWLNKADGSGTFTLKGTSTVTTNGAGAVGAALTVVKPDTNLDFVVADGANPGNIWTMKGDGKGDFTAASPASVAFTGQLAAGTATTVVFADFNNDGFLDFAGSSAANFEVQVYINNGANTAYNAPLALDTTNHKYESCFNLAGDLSKHPGAADIVSANCDNGVANRTGNVTVFVNNGNGTFTNSNVGTYYTAGAWPTGLAIADINGDGNNDLVVTDQQAGDVTVLLGNGDGTLQDSPSSVGYAIGGGPRTGGAINFNPALVADFNGDGHLDLMLPDFLYNFIYAQGYGDGTFRSALNYYSTIAPGAGAHATSVGIATGNFIPGNSAPDFVIGNANDSGLTGGVTVFLSNADGSMQPGVTYTGAATAQLQYVVVADVNGDGIPDIVATDGVNGGVQIFTGNGDGTFTPGTAFPTDTVAVTTLGIVVGDFNGDGFPDLAVINQTGANTADVGVLLNDSQGHGNFTLVPGNPALPALAQELATADINGDKKLDLTVPISGTVASPGSSVAVFLGNGDGTFTPGTAVTLSNNGSTFYQPIDAAIGDLNGDGKPDLIVSTDDQVPGSANQGIVVALGNGDGTFQTPNFFLSSFQSGPDPMGVQLIDLNRDGHLDVIASNYTNGTVAVMYGKGDGTLYDPVEYVSSLEPFGLALADVNGDGAVDVVASGDGKGFSGVNVLLNTSADSVQVPASSTNPSEAGVPITLSTTVAGSKVRGVTNLPTGSVTFLDGATALGSAPLNSSGQASLSVGLIVGTHSITAQYGGDANYLAITSKALSQVVTQSPDATKLVSSANPASPGQTVTFTATVASTVAGDKLVPTGQVTFSDGSTALGTVPLNSSGVATLSTTKLATGSHSITAQYGGDTNFTGSKSSALNQAVTQPTQPTYTLAANPTKQTVNPGSAANYVITLTPLAGYDGTVTISCPTSGLPSGVTCNNPSIVPGKNNNQGTLTISTTGPTGALKSAPNMNSRQGESNLWASLSGLGLIGMVLAGDWKKRNRRFLGIALTILAVVMILALVGCGGGSSSGGGGGGGGTGGGGGGTPAGTYQLSVSATGTAGTNNGNTKPQALPITLVVQ